MKKILEMSNISKYIFNVASGKPLAGTNVKILDNVQFDLYEGEIHALLGENGAGKSTLMKIIGGVIPYDEGIMKLNGKEVRFESAKDATANGIAFVHQELNLCTNIDVAHNFFLGREPVGKFGIMKEREMYEKSAETIRSLGYELDTHTKLGKLSTAQQQMVEISKALAMNAKIIIMDEPTASLTKKELEALFELIDNLKKKGISIIYISHRLDEIQQIGDRMTVMRDGCFVGTMNRENYSDEKAINMMAGRTANTTFKITHSVSKEITLKAENVKIGEATAPLNIQLHRGEVVGLCGLVGSGRTELAKTIFGARESGSGNVEINGKTYNHRCPTKSIEKGIVYLSEDRKIDGLITGASVGENMVLAALKILFPNNIINIKLENAAIEKLAKRFNVKCRSATQLIATLSGGNQQKVSLAKCFAAEPKILLLDEPTRGIDVNTKFEIYNLIDKAASEGLSILLISSEMSEIIGLCDRIYIMRNGTVTGEVCNRAEMTQENLVAKIVGVDV